MWIAGLVFGIAVVVLGIWLVREGLVHETPTGVQRDGLGSITSPFPGVTVILIGIAITGFSLLQAGGGSDAPKRNVKRTTPSSPSAPRAAESSPTPIETPTNSAPSETPTTTETPTITETTAQDSCEVLDEAPSRRGPWDGCANDVTLVVSRVERRQSDRLRLYLRLENHSDVEVEIGDRALLAVDDKGGQYEMDEERTTLADGAIFSLAPGERKAGYVGLDQSVPTDVSSIRVEFNVSTEYEFGEEEFFDVRVNVGLQSLQKDGGAP